MIDQTNSIGTSKPLNRRVKNLFGKTTIFSNKTLSPGRGSAEVKPTSRVKLTSGEKIAVKQVMCGKLRYLKCEKLFLIIRCQVF